MRAYEEQALLFAVKAEPLASEALRKLYARVEELERLVGEQREALANDRCERAGYHVCGPGFQLTGAEADSLRRVVERYGNHFRRDEDYYILDAALQTNQGERPPVQTQTSADDQGGRAPGMDGYQGEQRGNG